MVVEELKGRLNVGKHSVVWNAVNLPGGVFLVVLKGAKGVKISKAILLN